MKKFAIIGKPVINSSSPVIYNELFRDNKIDAYYSRLLINDIKKAIEIFKLLKLDAINVTMPYKQMVYGLTDETDELAKVTETCNTLLFKNKTYGFNTDYNAFLDVFNQLNLPIYQNILLIGAGNTAITVVDIFKKYDKQIDIINRTKINIDLLKSFYNNINQIDENSIRSSYDVVINTSADLAFFEPFAKKTQAKVLIDFNYIKNPLVKLFPNHSIFIDGFEILKSQAKYAFQIYAKEIFNLEQYTFDDDKVLNILRSKRTKKSNIAFVGMTNVGKTEISKALASELNMNYISIDELIQNRAGKSIEQIFQDDGEEKFREIESDIIKTLSNSQNSIIDTGGGSCLKECNIDMLKSYAFVIFLARKPEIIWDEIELTNRPLLKDLNYEKFQSIYENRLDNYFKCSDLIFCSTNNLATTIEILKDEIRTYFNAH